MTVPSQRKRVKHIKSRNGCFTCRARRVKCDERRPACLRCERADRVCAGFPSNTYRAESLCMESRALEPRLRTIPRFGPEQFMLDAIEIMALDFYHEQTIHVLPGCAVWRRPAVWSGCQEPALAHAIIAVAFLHRASTYSCRSVATGYTQHELAYLHYAKSLAKLQKYIAQLGANPCRNDEGVFTILSIALLLFSFEVLAGRTASAAKHFHAGAKLLLERASSMDKTIVSPSGDMQRCHLIEMPIYIRSELDMLTLAYVRLGTDVDQLQGRSCYLLPFRREPMPGSFSFLGEANIWLECIEASLETTKQRLRNLAEVWVLSWPAEFACQDELDREHIIEAATRIVPLVQHTNLLTEIELHRHAIQSWSQAFAALTGPSERDDTRVLTELYFFLVWFEAETLRNDQEVDLDRFHAEFEHFTRLLESHLKECRPNGGSPPPGGMPEERFHDPPAFLLGTGLVRCLRIIAMKCRDSVIRRRCIAMMGALNLKGLCNHAYLCSALEWAADSEESQARVICDCTLMKDHFTAHDIPEEARLFDVVTEGPLADDGEDCPLVKPLRVVSIVRTGNEQCPLTTRTGYIHVDIC